MRAVNLLPQKHRPAAPTGQRSGSSYVVLGALGAVLVAVLFYVLTVNSINDKKEQVAQAQKETRDANAKTSALQPYGDFSTVAQTRLNSVRQQAEGRIDWERLVREIAHVMPENTWLMSADAAADPSLAEGGQQEGITGPSIKLTGCADNQRDVATMLVRLRRLSGASDVKLKESSQGEEQAPATGVVGGSENAEDCGTTNHKPNYKWEATVLFDPNQAAPAAGQGGEAEKVPARLGGGS